MPALAVPQLGSCASLGRAWRLWAALHSQEEADPLGAQPMPRVPELAAFKAADVTAFDPSGLQLDLVKLSAANTRQQHICRELQGAMKALGGGGGEGSAEEEEEAARRVELASKFDGTIGDIEP